MSTREQPGPTHVGLFTPPFTPASAPSKMDFESPDRPWDQYITQWTPPTSPQLPKQPRTEIVGLGLDTYYQAQSCQPEQSRDSTQPQGVCSRDLEPSWQVICPFDVEFVRDGSGQAEVFGAGAWSTVYKAVIRDPSPSALLYTPPTSPAIVHPRLVAIKVPSRKEAIRILFNESLILSHLASLDNYDSFCVPFYGLLSSSSSIVLSAVPLSLDTHIKGRAAVANANISTWTMSEPAIGSAKVWLTLAHQLITALAWLHTEADVVHGDIKPGNILLQPRHSVSHTSSTTASVTTPCISQYAPLFTDFSSSQVLSSATPTPNTLSAITREYTAPELLSSKVLLNPLSTATPASDIFSLAVTLLAAATGNTMVYDPSSSVWQRQAMATQGWNVISNIRSGDAVVRIPRQGTVERVCEVAVLKSDMGRIGVVPWKKMVERMMNHPEKTIRSRLI